MLRFLRNSALLIAADWFRSCHKKLSQHDESTFLFLFQNQEDVVLEDEHDGKQWTEHLDLLASPSIRTAPVAAGAVLMSLSVGLVWMGVQSSELGLVLRCIAIFIGVAATLIALKVAGLQFIQLSSAIAAPDSIETMSLLGSQSHLFDRVSCCVYFFPSNIFSVNCDAIIVSGTSLSNYSVIVLSSETAKIFASMYGNTYHRVSTIDPKASS